MGADTRNNREFLAATLAAAAAGGNSVDIDNPHGDSLHLVVDITAITGTTPSITVTVQGKDPASGKYYTLLASAALSAVATTVLRIFPGAVAAANTVANDFVPRTFRILWAIAGTTPAVTGTIGGTVLAAGGTA